MKTDKMINKEWLNKNSWWLILIVIFPLFIWIGKGNREKEERINKNGEITIGTVVNRTNGRGPSPGNRVYGIGFDFYIGDSLIRSHNKASEDEYYQAIVGMKYLVKYLESKPNHNSIIYVNKPDIDAYENIELERQKIRERYENANVFLTKNARDLESLGIK